MLRDEQKNFTKENYYLNIFGDYLIEVYLDQKISKQIGSFFAKTSTLTDVAKTKLLKIISQRGKNKLVISRNSKKATKYKKALGKCFFISRGQTKAAGQPSQVIKSANS